ncbi:CinA family protein [Spiroplasma endosymbiont of Panorpa germanica]|uniref:CinA family protein n=1 Tax=Spiroplasma endosymbiont of Panorpa germanica TaxID=3066314 RepID=UPI0030D3ABE3
MKKLLKLLIDKNLTICACESFTGGLFANEITNIPNASKVFSGSLVTYSIESKTNIVDVKKETLENYTTVSSQVALQMAKGALKKFNSDICVSFTGNAGPGPSDNPNIGLGFIAIVTSDFEKVIKIELKINSRKKIKKLAVKICVEQLIYYIKNDFHN